MAGFPKVPTVNGDTDDDASIHMHKSVGRAQPLPRAQTVEDQMRQVWYTPVDPIPAIREEFENYSRESSRHGLIDDVYDEYESDATMNEPDPIIEKVDNLLNVNEPKNRNESNWNRNEHNWNRDAEPNRALFEQAKYYKENIRPLSRELEVDIPIEKDFWQTYKVYFYITLVGFILTLGYLIYPVVLTGNVDDVLINHKFNAINFKIDKLEKSIVPKHEYDQIKSDLKHISNNVDAQQLHFQDLQDQFANLQKQFNNIPDYTQLQSQLDNLPIDSSKLQEFQEKLNKLTLMTNSLDNLQEKILKKLIDSLPQYIPVYIKDNKIHFIEEFHNYLFKFIDNYQKSKGAEPYQPSNSTSTKINKSKIEELINTKLQENNQQIYEKINNFIDNLNINDTSSIHIKKTTDEIFLNELLDIFNKGLVKINYSDYNMGARILGFLTNLNMNNQGKSISKMFTGWFDYFGTNSQPVNNANNVLLDREWQCQSNQCSIGIRLFSPIIISDIFIKNTNLKLVTLYVKPSDYKQVDELKQYIAKFKLDTTTSTRSKYIKKFFKIKTITVDNPQLVHLKVPISLVNMKIPAKDIYLEFTTDQEVVTMNSIKVYGITEFNSFKYSQDFNKMVGSIQDDNSGFEDILLGDDDY